MLCHCFVNGCWMYVIKLTKSIQKIVSHDFNWCKYWNSQYRVSALQDLRKAGLLIFANKQDVKGCMTVAEISQSLQLTSVKDHQWHIQACCALTGEGWEEHSSQTLFYLIESKSKENQRVLRSNFNSMFLSMSPSISHLSIPHPSHVFRTSRLCQGLEWMMSRLRVRWCPPTRIKRASFLPPNANLYWGIYTGGPSPDSCNADLDIALPGLYIIDSDNLFCPFLNPEPNNWTCSEELWTVETCGI